MNLILNNTNFDIIRSRSLLHYADEKILICSKKNILYQSKDAGKTWENWIKIPIGIFAKLKIKTQLSRRFFRQYIYHVLPGEEFITVFGFGNIYIYNIISGDLLSVNPIQGSRPLVVTTFEDDIYYGQYTSNRERNPISIFKSSKDKLTFDRWYTFDNIRHIHGVQKDPFSGKLYVTTGDDDKECFIGYFEGKTFVPLIYGDQQARSIQLLFAKDHIYYATDAPDDENYIYRICRKDFSKEKLQKVGGPIFYGFNRKDVMFFSTICEPSKVNNEKNVELWASIDGGNWKCILTFKKDIFHMKLFQYGQIIFPGGKGNDDYIYFTAFATELDQQILKFPLDVIRNELNKL